VSEIALPPGITLRLLTPPISSADEDFLIALYGSTREQELAPLPWDTAQREAFIKLQHTAQLRHYQSQYPEAVHQIILSGNLPIGRSYVDRREREIRILDLSLLPKYRGQGFGSSLIRGLIDEAKHSNKTLSVYLEAHNQYQTLFARLGFKPVEAKDANILFEWRPASFFC
jgi:RimJ/RimL family protein N-acetyltransferase